MAVTKKKMYTFAIDFDAADALKSIKARDGIPESEQIRRGIAMWIQSKGLTLKSAQPRKRATGARGRR